MHETINRLSYITNQPMKDIAERLCVDGLANNQVIDYLSISVGFKRDYYFSSTNIKLGDPSLTPKRTNSINGEKKPLTIRFTQEDYDNIAELSHCMGKTISSSTALLIEAALKQPDLLNDFIQTYLDEHLDENRKKQLKKVLKFINRHNPYNEKVSLMSLINLIVEDILTSDATKNIRQGIDDFISSLLED